MSNTYDGQSRLVKRVLPEGNSVEYEYDDATCLSQLRCTHNVKTVRQATSPGYSATLTYDAEGRLRQTNLGGSITNLLYDGVALIGEYDASDTPR